MQLLTKLFNSGVTKDMSFISAKRVKAFNTAAVFGFIIGWAFVIIDFSHRRYILVGTDFMYVFATSFLIYANHKKKYLLGFLITTASITIAIIISSILFKTGMEYFLFLLLTMGLIYKTGKKGNYDFIILFFSSLFIAITIFNYKYTIYDDLGNANRVESIIVWMFIQSIFLKYFGNLNSFYKRDLQGKNNLLQNQKALLTNEVQQFEKSNQKLHTMNNAKEKIFSIIAHDVKSPIAAIRGSLDLLNSDAISKDDFIELSKVMSVRIKQLKDNLDILLEWSKSQMQGIEIKPEMVKIQPIIISTINLLLQSIELKKIKIHLKIDEHLKVFADPNHISLILRNLITNAIKYSHKESEIFIKAEKSNNYISVTVQDYGIGIDEETLSSLFNTVKINPQYGTLNERGTGLGLLLCKEFVEKNNGYITVQSEKGKGSAFTFNLPAN